MTDVLSALKALADENRLAMARLLSEGAFTVGEVQGVLALGQSTASRHLKILADAGLIECRREGRLAYYRWSEGTQATLSALKTFVQAHAPAIAEDSRRRLHGVYEQRAERTRAFFDDEAAERHWAISARDGTRLRPADVLADLCGELPGAGVIVDLGTGAGRLLAKLAGPQRRIVGVDASERMLEKASQLVRELGLSRVELRLGRLEHLPLADGEADVVVMHQVLHHCAQPESALAEARRILKPGGRLLLADYLPHAHEWMREELADQWLGFDSRAISRMCAAAGFADVHTALHHGRQGDLPMFLAIAQVPASRDQKPSKDSKPAASSGRGVKSMPVHRTERDGQRPHARGA